MSFSFETKLAAVEHELALRQWWLVENRSMKALKPEAAFRQIEVLEAIATDYRRAIARRPEPVNAADNLRQLRQATHV
jgi:hypothetical protein